MEKPPKYEALNKNGDPYWRPAQTIGELPHSAIAALRRIAEVLHVERVPFGAPLWYALGLTKKEAAGHRLYPHILLRGEEMPLDLILNRENG
jgi:hypothetical protein